MFQQFNPASMPGVGSSNYARGRAIWLGLQGVQYLPIGAIIDSNNARDPDNYETGGNETEPMQGSGTGTNIPQPPNATQLYDKILRAGLLMGKITTSGFYGASIMGVTSTIITASSTTSVTVSAKSAAELSRRVGATGTFTITGAATTGGTLHQETVTYSAINTTTGVITISTTTNTYQVGAIVGPTDGSQTPITFVDEQFGLNIGDATGGSIQMNPVVTGGAAVYGAPFPRVPVAGGTVNVNNIVYYSSMDASVKNWVKFQLQTAGSSPTTVTSLIASGKFVFSDSY